MSASGAAGGRTGPRARASRLHLVRQDRPHPGAVHLALGAPPDRPVPGVLDQDRVGQRRAELVDRRLNVFHARHPPPGPPPPCRAAPVILRQISDNRRKRGREVPPPRRSRRRSARPTVRMSHQIGRLPERSGDCVMTVPAGRTALFPIGPTAPLTFAAGSPERASVGAALKEVRQADYDVANLIGGREVRTGRRAPIVTPHEHARRLGHVHYAGAAETTAAIEAALAASAGWGRLPWEERAAPFLRAADMLQDGPWRDRLNAATMLEL